MPEEPLLVVPGHDRVAKDADEVFCGIGWQAGVHRFLHNLIYWGKNYPLWLTQ